MPRTSSYGVEVIPAMKMLLNFARSGSGLRSSVGAAAVSRRAAGASFFASFFSFSFLAGAALGGHPPAVVDRLGERVEVFDPARGCRRDEADGGAM